MATKYPISKAEFKKRVRLIYECWPKEMLVAHCLAFQRGVKATPGCIMQTALETTAFYGENMNGKVIGVSGRRLGEIAQLHDNKKYAEVLAAVEAL